jgi:site-specific DNA recombinase
MSSDARLAEIGMILAAGIVRLNAAQVLAALKRDGSGASEADAIAALHAFTALWSQLFPAEQARVIQLLVRRVTVTAAGLEVDIRREGIAGVVREMITPRQMVAAE